MAITLGRLEGLITVPTGGWTGTVNDGGGADTWTIAAGTYYLLSVGSAANHFLKTFELALEAAQGGSWTVSITATENGTGIVTVALNGGGTAAINWTSTDARDLMGFTGNLSAAATHVATRQARSLWIADCPVNTPYGGSDSGTDLAATAQMVSPAGHVTGVRTNRMVHSRIWWDACAHTKTRIAGETTVNTSFQKWWRDTVEGTAGWAAAPFGPFRLYPDAGDDTTYKTYKVGGELAKTFAPEQVQDGWLGLWRIVMDRVYEVPS